MTNFCKKYLYNILFCVLALIAVYFAIRDIAVGCGYYEIIVDNVISVIFIIDYFMRLFLSADKKSFFRNNVLDLIAIIPFTSLFKVFRVFKIFKMIRLLKILKLVRISACFGRLYKRTRSFFNTNGFKYMVLVCVCCIVAGGVAIHFAEGMSIQDGIWWSFVTATTVGYGDISPSTPAGRAVAGVLMIVGIGLIGSLTSTITSFFFRKSDSGTRNELIHSIQSQLDSFDDLSDDDIDVICNTLKNLHKK